MPFKSIRIQSVSAAVYSILVTGVLHALFLAGLFGVVETAAAQEATAPSYTITRITPEGDDIPPNSQIVFQFDRPMVPVGRMERTPDEIPVRIEPALQCEWRWLNTTSLACQLTESNSMVRSTVYKVTIDPGLKALDGSVLPQQQLHRFTTERPRITESWFKTWKTPGTPHIRIAFNQKVTAASIMKHVFLRDDKGKRHEVQALKVKKQNGLRWTLHPKAELPLDTPMELYVEPGLISREGPEASIEDRVVSIFHTFPEFAFQGVKCFDNGDNEIFVAETAAPTQRCNPLNAIWLVFNTPVLKEDIKDAFSATPDLAGGRKDFDPWEGVYSYSRLRQPNLKDQQYTLSLPYGLKAFEKYQIQATAEGVKDEFGRTLKKPIQMSFLTDHRQPRYHLEHRASVLEKDVDSHLPVIVTNLKQLSLQYQTWTTAGSKTNVSTNLKPYDAEDIAYAYPVKIRELLGGKSGVIQGTLSTVPSTSEGNTWFISQVTPFNVHVKLGHFNTLVWVTRFDTGEAVKGANVKTGVNVLTQLNSSMTALGEGITDENGIAMLPGTEKLDPKLEHINVWENHLPRLMFQVTKGEDMALVPISYEFQVYSDGAWGDHRMKYGHLSAWGSTAQGIYRAGDTVQFKLWVRHQDNDRFVPAPQKTYKLQVFDPTDKVAHEVADISLNEFGGFDGEFTVPKTGAVGWYRFVLTPDFSTETWEPLRVLISDFTPAPFKVLTELSGKSFAEEEEIKVHTEARLHAGGPYASAASRVTALLSSSSPEPADPKFDSFSFLFDNNVTDMEVHSSEGFVDEKGNLDTTFKISKVDVAYGSLTVESTVRDDRGKYVANRAKATYVGRDRYVGLRYKDWLLKKDVETAVDVLVIDDKGQVAAGAPVNVKVEYRDTKAARVKGPGNAFIVKYNHEWVPVGECSLQSASEPVQCKFTPTNPGTVRIVASVTDGKGRIHTMELQKWVVGSGTVLWETEPTTELQVSPEKRDYKVGETARFLVQNPFPGGVALISTERFGVQKHWTKIFNDSTEVIELPIEPDHLPGFYLSVVVVSPRQDKPIDERQVDLGKPAFRMGYVQMSVRDPAKEIEVTVKPRGEVFKPRDTVTVDISSSVKFGTRPDIEYAVTVLDESVFDLLSDGKSYFDPYEGFYKLDTLDLKNFNLIKLIVGRQKFEKKGANAGGDGGGDLDMRSLFKFVSYWNPSLKADAEGKASITFEVPDNLTGWKVFAMAVSKEDRMGLGEGEFKVNKETEIRPALPNQVLETDSFDANFTVMNRSENARNLDVSISASGNLEPVEKVQKTISAEPYKRYIVSLPVKSRGDGKIEFEVTAGDQIDRDGLKIPLIVNKRKSLEVGATYGTSTEGKATEKFAFPEGIRTDVGRVSVVLSPTVIGGVEGAFKYIQEYPYICWEQVLTKGVMASHFKRLRAYLPADYKWEEADGLPDATLKMMASYQAPNGGMSFFIPEDQYVSPYLSAYTAIALNWLRDAGYKIPEQQESMLHDYLLNMLRNNVMPDFYTEGMSSSVRAVALAALVQRGKADMKEVVRYKDHVKHMNLFGKAHFLKALSRLKNVDALQKEAFRQIVAHANETGGKFSFTEPVEAVSERILDTNMRSNCSILSAMLDYRRTNKGATSQVAEMPFKLVRFITQTRKQKDYWQNTQENMFCLQALIDFSTEYEKDRPQYTIKVALGDEAIGEADFTSVQSPTVEVERPIKEGDPGTTRDLTISKEGAGRYYYSARMFYAPADLKSSPINSGMEVRREYSVERDGTWVILKSPFVVKQGELIKVDLFLRLPAPRNFVVVDDPVPGGLEPVNRDLATASTVDADKAQYTFGEGSIWFDFRDWIDFGVNMWSFYHKELRHDSARFYSEYLPAGNYHLAYTAQAIASGEFTVLPTHTEEMYDPDVYGKSVPEVLKVQAQ